MKNDPQLKIEIRDLTTGLWIWRCENPFWKPGVDWEPLTTSTCVESEGEILVLDPQAPPEDAVEVWERLDVCHPTAVVILKPDHVRNTDLFVPCKIERVSKAPSEAIIRPNPARPR